MATQLERILQINLSPTSEVLVVNNRSTDRTAEIVAEFAQRNRQVSLVNAPERAGVNYARNKGVLAARNRLILIFDADDIVYPQAVERLIALLTEADMVGGGYRELVWHPGRGDYVAGRTVTEAPKIPDGAPYALGAAMGFSKDLFLRVGGFDESYVGGHDEVDFSVRAYSSGARFAWLSAPVIDYRQRRFLRASVRQKFHYGRTSVQLVENFSPRFDDSVPSYKLLVRKQLAALCSVVKSRKAERVAAIEGLAWTSGRLHGAVLYRFLRRLPDRQLVADFSEKEG